MIFSQMMVNVSANMMILFNFIQLQVVHYLD